MDTLKRLEPIVGIRKDYEIAEVAKTLAQVQGVFLYDAVVERKVMPPEWVRVSLRVRPESLDKAGIRVRHLRGDSYSFTLKWDEGDADVFTCGDTVTQWQVDAAEAVRDGDEAVTRLAKRCGISRQSLYRILNGKVEGLQYVYTLRGRNPILFWGDTPLDEAYRRVAPDLRVYDLMEPVP